MDVKCVWEIISLLQFTELFNVFILIYKKRIKVSSALTLPLNITFSPKKDTYKKDVEMRILINVGPPTI